MNTLAPNHGSRDAFDNLRAKMAEPSPTTFAFDNPGDEILGAYVRTDVGATQFTEQCPIIVLRTEDGDLRSVWAFHAALRERFLKLDVQPGELVGIRYDGPRRNKADTASYKSYSVTVDRESPSVRLDELPPADDASIYDPEADEFIDRDF